MKTIIYKYLKNKNFSSYFLILLIIFLLNSTLLLISNYLDYYENYKINDNSNYLTILIEKNEEKINKFINSYEESIDIIDKNAEEIKINIKDISKKDYLITALKNNNFSYNISNNVEMNYRYVSILMLVKILILFLIIIVIIAFIYFLKYIFFKEKESIFLLLSLGYGTRKILNNILFVSLFFLLYYFATNTIFFSMLLCFFFNKYFITYFFKIYIIFIINFFLFLLTTILSEFIIIKKIVRRVVK